MADKPSDDIKGARGIRMVWAARYTLLIAIAAYGLVMMLGLTRLIGGELALLLGIFCAAGIAVAAMLCVIVQAAVFISSKRRVTNG